MNPPETATDATRRLEMHVLGPRRLGQGLLSAARWNPNPSLFNLSPVPPAILHLIDFRKNAFAGRLSMPLSSLGGQ